MSTAEPTITPLASVQPSYTTIWTRSAGRTERASLQLDLKTIVQVQFKPNMCCGVYEMHSFWFSLVEANVPPPEVGTKWLHEVVNEVGLYSNKGIIHLTLTRSNDPSYRREEPSHQPQWFAAALRSWPKVVEGPWMLNPNSGNQIKMFMLQCNTEDMSADTPD